MDQARLGNIYKCPIPTFRRMVHGARNLSRPMISYLGIPPHKPHRPSPIIISPRQEVIDGLLLHLHLLPKGYLSVDGMAYPDLLTPMAGLSASSNGPH